MKQIAVADVGGTHARFALADIDKGRVIGLDEPVTLKTAEHGSFQLAWQEFGRRKGIDLPQDMAMAFAGPVGGELLKLTNNPWVIRPSLIKERLGVDRYTIVNDFGAVAYAVATLGDEDFRHVCGPDRPLPDQGVISIVGPGTGLGVAALLKKAAHYEVIETEGGHVDFAPLDSLANAALDRLCLTLGAVAGDMALAQGAAGVVIAGGVGLRIADYLPQSGFRDRFIAKGRFERRMDEMPVKLITHPQPGLWGAAAAFAREHL
jgi:glucokinase